MNTFFLPLFFFGYFQSESIIDFVFIIWCILSLYPLDDYASQIICSMCVCQFYSLAMVLFQSRFVWTLSWMELFFFSICGPSVGLTIFGIQNPRNLLITFFKPGNQSRKLITNNTLKSMGKHFVWTWGFCFVFQASFNFCFLSLYFFKTWLLFSFVQLWNYHNHFPLSFSPFVRLRLCLCVCWSLIPFDVTQILSLYYFYGFDALNIWLSRKLEHTLNESVADGKSGLLWQFVDVEVLLTVYGS